MADVWNNKIETLSKYKANTLRIKNLIKGLFISDFLNYD